MFFVDFLFELRRQGLKVGATEAVALAQALTLGLHESSLDGFYDVARALCVHREGDLDAFDRAFATYFRGVTSTALELTKALESWLNNPIAHQALSPEELALLKQLNMDELKKLFEQRLKEQKERHDGGNRWIGTGGSSPFGMGGEHPSGVRIGRGGGRSAMAVAEARLFQEYRSDVILDVRSIELALRRLKVLARDGAPLELDLEGTIQKTAREGGELDLVFQPPRKPSVKVLLLMDVGGSMDPHAELVSRLFSAAKRASNFKQIESYYFHNAIYGKVFKDAAFRDGQSVTDIIGRCDGNWKLIMLGDALMHPTELMQRPWNPSLEERGAGKNALEWFQRLSQHFPSQAWLNPEPERYWNGTAEVIAGVFPMFELTLDGLTRAVRHLSRRKPI